MKVKETRTGEEVQIDQFEDDPEAFKILQDDNVFWCPYDKEFCRKNRAEWRCRIIVRFKENGQFYEGCREDTRCLCELIFEDEENTPAE